MGIGFGIFLLAVGGILYFAVDATVSGLDISTVGIILMLAGALSVVLDLVIFMPRRRRTTVVSDAAPRVVTRETDVV